MIEIVQAKVNHKYLGRYLWGEFSFRESVEINHRIKCGWYAFGKHAGTLCNRNISIKLRLKLFDAVVTPTILFGLSVLPLSQVSLQKIKAAQRKMLRKIVGWVRLATETWEETMRRRCIEEVPSNAMEKETCKIFMAICVANKSIIKWIVDCTIFDVGAKWKWWSILRVFSVSL